MRSVATIVFLVCISVAANAPASTNANIAGVYSVHITGARTVTGAMRFAQSGPRVVAVATNALGIIVLRFDGTLSGHTMRGYWRDAGGEGGWLTIQFASTGFSGTWGFQPSVRAGNLAAVKM